jgi:PAS domain S-box-containing protein
MNSPTSSSLFSSTGKALSSDFWSDLFPGMLWVCDANKKCTFLNKAWLQYTGGKGDTGDAEEWLMKIHPDDRLNFILDFDLGSSTRSPFHYQCRLLRSDGIYRWVAGTANPISDSKGEFGGYAGSCIDINEIKVGQTFSGNDKSAGINSLAEKNRLAETVLDSTLSMICVVDRNLHYVIFNKQLEEYTGVNKENALGRQMFEVFPTLKNTDVASNVEKALAGEIVHLPPKESVLHKGKYFESYFIPLRTSPDKVDGVIIKVHDRTDNLLTSNELIRSNKKLEEQNFEFKRQTRFVQAIFDSILDVIAVVDKGYHYVSINNSAIEKYGIRREDIIGKHIVELFPSVADSGMYRDLEKAMSGEFVYDLSYSSRILQRIFQNYYVPLKDDEGSVYAVMIIGHDITDVLKATDNVKEANDVLAQKNRELERSNQELEQFAYVASHDLQEPIRKIATYANKLLTRNKEQLSEETTTYLNRINNATKRMYELINGLLVYSRVTREGNLFVPTPIDNILKQVLNDFELKIAQKKAIVQYNRFPSIEAVPVQISQMFSNLISNSLKFSKPEVTPVIQISSSDLDEEQKEFYQLHPKVRYLNIFYLDNGIGFEQQFADKIFELFQRLHHKHLYEGSGIGLSICKKIVTNHNGLIYAFSEPDKGVTFQIILPYTQTQFSSSNVERPAGQA